MRIKMGGGLNIGPNTNDLRIGQQEKLGDCLDEEGKRNKEEAEKFDISDSEIKEYKAAVHRLLKFWNYKVWAPNGQFRCPFCVGEEKQGYHCLLQHAVQVAEDPTRSAKQRANHSAMAKYLVIDLAGEDKRKREKQAVGKALELERMLAEKQKLEMDNMQREKQAVEKALALERMLAEKHKLEMDIMQREKQAVEKALELEQRLAEKHKSEMDNMQREKQAVEKAIELELDEKHKLESEIEDLKDQINHLQVLSRDLTIKERQCNDELQGARKALIKGLSDMRIGHRSKIGIKRMGEIDPKAFKKTCNERFLPEDAETRALELCSLWQENLRNPQWHPFRVVPNGMGIPQRLLNEDDALLRGLKDEWGEEIYDAVVTALKDLHEYNPSGCYLVSEFWNLQENRKATLTEVIGHVCTQLKTLKRKRLL